MTGASYCSGVQKPVPTGDKIWQHVAVVQLVSIVNSVKDSADMVCSLVSLQQEGWYHCTKTMSSTKVHILLDSGNTSLRYPYLLHMLLCSDLHYADCMHKPLISNR